MDINHILIVDDDADDSEFFTTAVHQINPSINVAEAFSKEDLFQQLGEAVPDLLFIDSFLQQETGQAAIEILRTNAAFARLPIIMYTGSSDAKSIRTAFAAGASAYIVKPNTLSEIRSVLQQVLNKDWKEAGAFKQVYSGGQFRNFEP